MNEGQNVNLNVMTYNIRHGKGMDKKVDLARISHVIASSGADVIGLNEVDKNFSSRSHFADQVQFLAEELKLFHAFSPSLTKHTHGVRQYGNALLSRYPILTSEHYLFNFISGVIEGRSILETTIEVNRKVLNVYVTHLSLSPFLHKKQSEFICKNAKSPGIILGDWNMTPGSKKWNRVAAANFHDVWHEVGTGHGNTFPSLKPRTRLDYIFVTEDINIMDAEVVNTMPIASDHLPVVAVLSV